MGEARRGQRSHGDSRSLTETPGSVRTRALKRFRFYPTPPEAPTERCNGKKGRNAAAGFEVEMSPHTEYQRPVFHPPLMPDEGSQSLSALNTNRTRARSRSPRRTPAFAGSFFAESQSEKGKSDYRHRAVFWSNESARAQLCTERPRMLREPLPSDWLTG